MSVTDEQEKKFVIKHVFRDVTKQLIKKADNAEMIGSVEEHFDIEWRLRLFKENNKYIDFHLDCLHADQSSDWSIEASFEAFANGKKVGATKELVFSKDCRSNDASTYISLSQYNEFSTNNEMPVEFRVTIMKMTGIEKKKLRNFDDDSAKEHSDVVLKIVDQQFYVYKMYLSLHSSYFKALFSGNFSESGKSEIELKDIAAESLQNFLELIYGESVINEGTISDLLKLADFFDSKTVIRRCEEFLLNRSQQSLKFKFQMAIKYGLDTLKRKCLNEMDKDTNFSDFAPENASDFSPEVWKELYEKCASFV